MFCKIIMQQARLAGWLKQWLALLQKHAQWSNPNEWNVHHPLRRPTDRPTPCICCFAKLLDNIHELVCSCLLWHFFFTLECWLVVAAAAEAVVVVVVVTTTTTSKNGNGRQLLQEPRWQTACVWVCVYVTQKQKVGRYYMTMTFVSSVFFVTPKDCCN